MGLQRVTQPISFPITRAEAKAHLRVEHTLDDATIDLYIAGETAYAEDFTGRAFVPQTWDYFIDGFPAEIASRVVELPLPRVIAVAGVFYLDADQAEQEVAADSYVLDLASEPARLGLAGDASWPTTSIEMNAVRIRFDAGYQDGSVSPPTPDVLADIKIALLLRVEATYRGGDDAAKLRDAAEIYLRRRRVHLALA